MFSLFDLEILCGDEEKLRLIERIYMYMTILDFPPPDIWYFLGLKVEAKTVLRCGYFYIKICFYVF